MISPLRILIADDEPPARARLRYLVEALGHAVCGEAADGSTVLALVENLRPDGVLLDIEMPGLNGLVVAQRLEREFPEVGVVLVTAHSEHALAAFDADVQDYVLKPVRPERLNRALERISARRSDLAKPIAAPDEPTLALNIGRREQLLALADIDCLIAEEGYVLARSAQLEGFVNASLQDLEDRFPQHLLRIHRSCLAVKTAIAGLETRSGNDHRLLFRDGLEPVTISRRQLPAVKLFIKARDLTHATEPDAISSVGVLQPDRHDN